MFPYLYDSTKAMFSMKKCRNVKLPADQRASQIPLKLKLLFLKKFFSVPSSSPSATYDEDGKQIRSYETISSMTLIIFKDMSSKYLEHIWPNSVEVYL